VPAEYRSIAQIATTPSGPVLTDNERTLAPPSLRFRSALPSVVSHSVIVPESSPLTSLTPSGQKATVRAAVGPSVWRRPPEATSQTAMLPLPLAVATSSPSGLTAASLRHRPAGLDIGRGLKSERPKAYIREFRVRLLPHRQQEHVRAFTQQLADDPLWRASRAAPASPAA
jgi:hypothetical protein